ncbi:FmdB family zinc ribbon protein [Azospirillum sp. ST 5-10]|uniref:FmdB family zinc ribbon protein n=1 Tax=unclassified Azospirillum TaxID=2630922 RepID=UPI003F49CBF6
MPMYEYLCAHCGPFSDLRPMSRSAEPAPCPGCGAEAPRAILTAPHFSLVAGATRRAVETNERSAHAPMSSAEYKERRAAGHGAGCACCSGTKALRSAAVTGKDGAKAFPTKRPWMISH